jgi:hypothetical protein
MIVGAPELPQFHHDKARKAGNYADIFPADEHALRHSRTYFKTPPRPALVPVLTPEAIGYLKASRAR